MTDRHFPLPPLPPKPGLVGDLARRVFDGDLTAVPPLCDALRDQGRDRDAGRIEWSLATELAEWSYPESLVEWQAADCFRDFCRQVYRVLVGDLFDIAILANAFAERITNTVGEDELHVEEAADGPAGVSTMEELVERYLGNGAEPRAVLGSPTTYIARGSRAYSQDL